MLGVPGELDERGKLAGARGVERRVDAVGRELADALNEPLAVRGRLGAALGPALLERSLDPCASDETGNP